MADGSVHVGVMRVDLHLPGVDSLKGKRALLNRARAALQNELSVSVAEVGHQDLWQRASLGVAVAASTPAGVERVLDRVIGVVERDPRVVVVGTGSFLDVLDPDEHDQPLPPGWA